MSKWKLAMAEKMRLKIANPDAAFNAVCPGWALFEAFKKQVTAPTSSNIVSNIFAMQNTSLRAVLGAVGYDLWDEPPSAAPAQSLTSINKILPFPAYNALEVVKDFLLDTQAKGQAA